MSYTIYLAPLQGITDQVYRTVLAKHFPELDKSFSPFLQTDSHGKTSEKKLLQKLSDKDCGVTLVPQLLSKDGEHMAQLSSRLAELGFTEVNLNMGCPYPTVTNKGRGSALLMDPEAVDSMLNNYFSTQSTPLSIKVRTGFNDHNEILELLPIFDRYPLHELIVHPRTAKEMYSGDTNLQAFKAIAEKSSYTPLYNGNITSREELLAYEDALGMNLKTVMIGRGIVRDPSLIQEIKRGEQLSLQQKAEINYAFLTEFAQELRELLSGDTHYLQRMKNVVRHMVEPFGVEKRVVKKLVKCTKAKQFDSLLHDIFIAYL